MRSSEANSGDYLTRMNGNMDRFPSAAVDEPKSDRLLEEPKGVHLTYARPRARTIAGPLGVAGRNTQYAQVIPSTAPSKLRASLSTRRSIGGNILKNKQIRVYIRGESDRHRDAGCQLSVQTRSGNARSAATPTVRSTRQHRWRNRAATMPDDQQAAAARVEMSYKRLAADNQETDQSH